jgi:hypothetical protein
MPSADQVPVKSPHLKMQWRKWVVLIAGSTGSALRAVRPPNIQMISHNIPRDWRVHGFSRNRLSWRAASISPGSERS